MRGPAKQPGCWPTLDQQWLIQATFDRPDAIEAWHRWRARVDIENVDPGAFRLLPLVYRNLSRLRIKDAWMPRLKGVHRQSWFRNQLLLRRTGDSLRVLQSAGIDTIVLKGTPLSMLYYKDEAVRPMADADILVRGADVPRAVALLQQAGWQSHRPLPPWPVAHRGSWGFLDGDNHELDLHWHVFQDCLDEDADDDLWSAARPIAVRGVDTRALAPEDQLLHVLVHGIHWNPVPSIRWVVDAVAIIEAAGADLEWDRFISQAVRRRFVPIAALGLGYVRETLGVPVPSSVLDRLTATPQSMTERIDLWSRMEGTASAGACRLWFLYLRSIERRGAWPDPVRFVRYLRAFWLTDSYWGLASEMRTKIARRHVKPSAPSPISHASS